MAKPLSIDAKVTIGKTISAIVLIIILSLGSHYNGELHTAQTANSEYTNSEIENQYSERSET